MKQILAGLKSKGLSILCIVLVTLLTASYLSGKSVREELKGVSEKLVEHVQLNKRLSDQNLELAEEIRTRPTEYITITKEVDRNICNGVVQQELINSLPSTKKGAIDEKKQDVANIDDRLPTDLIKLLK